MKKILLLLLLFPAILFAQVEFSGDYHVSSGAPYQVVDAAEKYYLTFGDEILMLKQHKNKTWVQKYNIRTKKLDYRKEYQVFKKNDVIEEFIQLKDKAIIFYSVWKKKQKTENLYYREIDLASGSLGEPVKLITVKGKVSGMHTGSWMRMKVVGKFKIYTSYNTERLVVQYRKHPEIKNDDHSYDMIGMHVYDADVNELWGGVQKMPYTEARMNNLDYQVDNNGIVYLLASVKNNKTGEDSHIEIIVFDGEAMDIINLEGENKSFTNMALMENSEGDIYLTGLYGDSDRRYHIDGFFYSKIDGGAMNSGFNYYPIPIEVVNQYQTERGKKRNKRKEKKGKSLLNNLELRRLISTSDGGTLLLGEEYYMLEHTSTNSKGYTTTYYTYHYENIYAMKLDKNGEMQWLKKLPKRQGGRRPKGGMSIRYLEHEDNHYIFFVDNLKNSNLPLDKLPAKHSDGKGGIFTAYVLDDVTGDVEKTNIVDFRKTPIKGEKKPKEIYQFSTGRVVETPDGLVFEVYKKKKEDVMVHIEFK